jgi:hypothetical protein
VTSDAGCQSSSFSIHFTEVLSNLEQNRFH